MTEESKPEPGVPGQKPTGRCGAQTETPARRKLAEVPSRAAQGNGSGARKSGLREPNPELPDHLFPDHLTSLVWDAASALTQRTKCEGFCRKVKWTSMHLSSFGSSGPQIGGQSGWYRGIFPVPLPGRDFCLEREEIFEIRFCHVFQLALYSPGSNLIIGGEHAGTIGSNC
jgi:hypothetical protein